MPEGTRVTLTQEWDHKVVELPLNDISALSFQLTSWGRLGFELVSVVRRPFRPALMFMKRRRTDVEV